MAFVDQLIEGGVPSEANHAFTAAKTFLSFCVARRYIKHSPLEGLKKPIQPKSRKRVLTDTELKKVLTATPSLGQYGTIVKLLIITGQREHQIATLQGEWLNRRDKTITFPTMKVDDDRQEIGRASWGERVGQLVENAVG